MHRLSLAIVLLMVSTSSLLAQTKAVELITPDDAAEIAKAEARTSHCVCSADTIAQVKDGNTSFFPVSVAFADDKSVDPTACRNRNGQFTRLNAQEGSKTYGSYSGGGTVPTNPFTVLAEVHDCRLVISLGYKESK